ncbi:MAG: cupredoxin domain-containing protein [Myxococcota bacterium]
MSALKQLTALGLAVALFVPQLGCGADSAAPAQPSEGADSVSITDPTPDVGVEPGPPDAGPPEEDSSEGLPCSADADCSSLADTMCQMATCDLDLGVCRLGPLKDYTPCDDGDACTLDEVCFEGVCSRGVQKICDDDNPCTDDQCESATGCLFEANTDSCDDGNGCTADDQCNAGACIGAATDACSCVEDSDCAGVDDDNLCNGTVTCVAGQCQVAPESVIVCDEDADNVCTSSVCAPETGLCSLTLLSDLPCSDGNACTEGDTCSEGVCSGSVAACECEADADCATFDDDNLCNGVMACVAGVCETDPATVVTCPQDSEADPCNYTACEPALGECLLLNEPDGTPCGDGLACTEGDVCAAGVCQGAPVTCDDSNPCTDDACSEADQGCAYVNNTAPCDDSDACTEGDICGDGACGAGTAVVCEDEDLCTDDSCDSVLGCMFKPVSCDDADDCTVDSCEAGLCTHTLNTEEPACTACSGDAACDDALPCTVDSCDLATGLCINAAKDCDDDNPCTVDACQDDGVCASTPIEAGACDDGDPCTLADVCEAGACVGTPDPSCTGCGDGACTDGETCVTCAADCGDCVGSCCDANGSAGCDDAEITACVCAEDDVCCTGTWDAACAAAANACGAPCDADTCCSMNDTGGCADPDIAACVCAEDDYCCTGEWDEYCVEDAVTLCGLTCDSCGDGECSLGEDCESCDEDCGGCPECGDAACTGDENCGTCPDDCGGPCSEGSCCEPNGSPGCEDADVNACVCALDGACCDVAWDALCVLFAVEYCELGEQCDFVCGDGTCDAGESCDSCSEDCGACGTCGDSVCDPDENCASCAADCGACEGSCCEAHDGPGCEDDSIALCVCDIGDPWCCEVEWDGLCVEVAKAGCGACEPELPAGFCCDAHGGLGCDDPAVEECVCAAQPFCCNGKWDEFCAEAAATCGAECGESCGDGTCSVAESCESCPLDCGACEGPCCEAHDGAGCADLATTTCVCDIDASCCDNAWTESCAIQAVIQCGWTEDCANACGDGTCSLGEDCSACPDDCGDCGDCGDDTCGPSETCTSCPSDCGDCVGSCCTVHETPGCEDADVSACVCDQDVWCCSLVWDELCVETAKGECDGCEAPPEPSCGDTLCDPTESCASCASDCGSCGGDCCAPHDGKGCDQPDVQACVCDVAPYCCEGDWDIICAALATQDCAASCDDIVTCGDAQCDIEENCTSCPGDCGACTGSCQEAHIAPGCASAPCTECVCAVDDFCCEFSWDVSCTIYVETDCAETCATDYCGDGTCGDGESCTNCATDCGECSANSCCSISEDGSPGCEQPDIESCVCGVLPDCCEDTWGWDGQCVGLAQSFCGATCDEPTSNCCEVHDAPGCNSEPTSFAVCDADPDCCEVTWDAGCVELAEEMGACGSQASCCDAHGGLGCGDAETESCVCDMDEWSYCCTFSWDADCVSVAAESCGGCAPDEPQTCCAASDTDAPGCDSEDVAACVCEIAEYCCTESWDGLCAGIAVEECGASCGATDGCGDGTCEIPDSVSHLVNITAEGYSPAELLITVGDSVTWSNTDVAMHSATQSSGPVFFNIPLLAGQQGSAIFPETGTYTYYDVFNTSQSFTGTIEVVAAQGETCASCPEDCGPCPGGDCCAASETPGCDDPAIKACVCGSDDPQASYCCDVKWDSYCVDLITIEGCGDCIIK